MQNASLRCFPLLSLIAGSIVLLYLATGAHAEDNRVETASELDKLLSALYPPDEPGVAVLVAKDGEVVLRKGYGLANIEHNIPITPETVFRIGSMTKFFTATAILLLVEQGKINLEDEIARFLPEYPTHGEKIKVRHVLAHTSGIWDYLNLA